MDGKICPSAISDAPRWRPPGILTGCTKQRWRGSAACSSQEQRGGWSCINPDDEDAEKDDDEEGGGTRDCKNTPPPTGGSSGGAGGGGACCVGCLLAPLPLPLRLPKSGVGGSVVGPGGEMVDAVVDRSQC